jgi:hypothetical protein
MTGVTILKLIIIVTYVTTGEAQFPNLVKSTSKSVILSVDTTPKTPGNRASVRMESKKTIPSGGLIIADLAHMPGSICGAWPAFWTIGPDWPKK